MSEPKLHHFVPQSYLKRFANERNQVAVRSRDGSTFLSNTRNVMAVIGLYKVPQQPLTAEQTLGALEEDAKEVLDRIDEERTLPPSGSGERDTLALYMGVQLARDPDHVLSFEFTHDVIEAIGDPPIDPESMRDYLERNVLGFEPHETEVQGACDFVNASAMQPDFPTREDTAQLRIDLMFNLGLQVAEHLKQRAWSLEAARHGELITSDRPVTIWALPSPEDTYRGVGIYDADEIWLPLDRTRLISLRLIGPERVRTMGPRRLKNVNEHIARHCTSLIAFHPENVEGKHLPLARRRPIIRFNTGPLYSGTERTDGEVLHVWKPIRDIPDEWSSPRPQAPDL
ncbi:MAG: DUF4238 domain-containing protein [Acidimicrobiia bacterium]|nr:DUF4238 domain-containing protein [Acidimicrobiia bacterium]